MLLISPIFKLWQLILDRSYHDHNIFTGLHTSSIMASLQVAAGALATIMAAAIYETTNDTVAWAVTASVMAVLLVFGWVLTKPPDGKPIKPDVTFDLKGRLF